jgi:hypothetical protein
MLTTKTSGITEAGLDSDMSPRNCMNNWAESFKATKFRR